VCQPDPEWAVIVVVVVEEFFAERPASVREPNRSGSTGAFFSVLNAASE
jgi:hypothetical protein